MLKEGLSSGHRAHSPYNFPVLLPCVEAGASLAHGRAELVVPQDTGMRIVFPQPAQQIHQGAFLGIGACVGRMPVFVKAALVADAEALVVPAGGVGADLVGEAADVVGERVAAHVVTMVVFVPQYVQHLLLAFAHGDDVCCVLRLGRVNDFAHHVDAVLHHHAGDILAVVRQHCEQASVAEVVGQVLGPRAPWQVGVAANHDALRIVQPRVEGLETLVQVARRPVGHADDKRIARFAEGERILSAFGDDKLQYVPFGIPISNVLLTTYP